MNDLPIGVFDSGVGGLTVLRALRERLPHESYIYLGDTARLPYGTKTGETVIRYALQAAGALVEQHIKALVIACNTASAYAIPALRRQYPHLPIVGVIEAGAAAACGLTENDRIAVMSTESTARSQAYPDAIARMRPEARVVSVPCSLLVALAEEGWTEGEIARQVVARYLEPVCATDPPDTVVLGCTHFPLLRTSIESFLGPRTMIVDSGLTAADDIAQRLRGGGQLGAGASAYLRFLATDGPDRFARVAFKFLGLEVPASSVETIELSPMGNRETA